MPQTPPHPPPHLWKKFLDPHMNIYNSVYKRLEKPTRLTVSDLDRNIDPLRKVLDLLNCVILAAAITHNYFLYSGRTATVLHEQQIAQHSKCG